MSINDKFTYLQQTKEKIKTAIQNKGVDVSDADTFRSYAEKIALIEGGGSGGDTTWAYHTGQAVAGDKVMLTKVNSLVTPDDAFCNGFRPYVIMDGYAYGRSSDDTSTWNTAYNKRRQIVNGVIDSSNSETISTTTQHASATNKTPHYGLNGSVLAEIRYQDTSSYVPFTRIVDANFLKGIAHYNPSWSSNRSWVFGENVAIVVANGSARSQFYSYSTMSLSDYLRATSQAIGFEDKNGEYLYLINTIKSTSLALYKININTLEEEALPKPTIIFNQDYDVIEAQRILLQTKDYKYLLHAKGYVDLDIENNTFTFNEFPPVILNEMGDRTLYCMQVFYDGYFSIQLSDGTTLMCKYTNSMEDVEIKEIIEPIIIEGDETIYQRHFSPDRMYWVNEPIYLSSNGTYPAVPLANNPAGPYKAKEATSDYVAYTPSKDRFNSTVLSGFLTGETKDEDGRKMVEVKTALGV